MTRKIEVDYGGTSIRFYISAPRGGNVRCLSVPSRPIDQLPRIIRQFLASRKIKRLNVLSVGAKSVWSKKEKNSLHQKLKGLAEKVLVCSDAEMAHARVFGARAGLVLIAGTGSIALGRNSNGKIARAGGLGPKRGDEGSGFWIGKIYLGRTGKDFKNKSVRDLAALAPQVIRRAQAGDPISKEIIHEAQSHLVRLASSVRRQLKEKSLRVRLTGGLFENAYFRKGFLDLLRSADAAL
ncbi:MAG: hypothetical protein A3A86_07525 [Elusimicrobia bacterium RIFCSPLOWO2_01_FULL_60_11]|nr:MAG: hypothetical protein A3A86_07525 [Elusimicrobia bacterium RIFCSPLOWO2_01_FULL_60_11]